MVDMHKTGIKAAVVRPATFNKWPESQRNAVQLDNRKCVCCQKPITIKNKTPAAIVVLFIETSQFMALACEECSKLDDLKLAEKGTKLFTGIPSTTASYLQ
jgi:hypothetical protein